MELTNSGLLRVSVLHVQNILRQMQKEAYWKVNANVTMGTKATPRETSLVQVTIIHWKRNEHVLALKKSTDLWSDHYTKVCPIEHSGQKSGTREGISSVPRAPIFRAEFQRKTAVLQSKRKQSKTCLELFKRKQTWTKGKLETFRTQSSFNCEYPVVTILFWASLNKFYAS